MPEPVVQVSGLVKRYDELVAVDHLDLAIAPGETFGLLGPNGSGKTTTLSCILQLLRYDEGEVRLFGEAMTAISYDLKRRVGVVPQEVAVFDELTVRENVDSFCALYVRDRARRRELVDEAIAFVGLERFERFRPKKLSGGLLRRLNIACGIAHKPELIILDEPTVAVDPQSRNAILEGVTRLAEGGATVIYTSHYMEEVEQVCSRVAIMDRGAKVAEGTVAQLKALSKTGEHIRVEVVGMGETALAQVRALSHVQTATVERNVLNVACSAGEHNLTDVLGVLAATGCEVGRVSSEPPTLNDVFLEITGRELRDEG